jgi:agmatinase
MREDGSLLKRLSKYFVPPEKTPAAEQFGGSDAMCTSFEDAKVVVYGVPFEGTATYGNSRASSVYGPWAIRKTSAEQIETYVRDKDFDPYADVGIFDLGDLRLPKIYDDDRKLVYDPPLKHATKMEIANARRRVNKAIHVLSYLQEFTEMLRGAGKVPVMLGGEHLVTLWPLKAVTEYEPGPVVLHFDAHMDMKRTYLGMSYSHTTPMYHALYGEMFRSINGNNFVQIGIRQGSRDEFENAEKKHATVFSFEFINDPKKFDKMLNTINDVTKQRKVYITFDIDALDSCYTPFTGTPEPFGMTPYQAYEIIGAINEDAKIIGMDMMEVASDGVNTIEGTVATQLLLRMLAHPSLRKK